MFAKLLQSLFICMWIMLFVTLKAYPQDKPPSLYDKFMNSSVVQSKFVQRFISTEKDSTRSAGFLVLPVLGYGPETGFEYGLSGIYNFYTDRSDSMIRTSNLILQGTLTTENQSNLKLTSDIWTKGNKFHYYGELRYRNFPFNFYGIGDHTAEADKDLIIQERFRIKFDGERRIFKNYYAGLGLVYENYSYRDTEPGGIFETLPLRGRNGGHYLALGVSQSYDSRNSNTYTTRGYFARAAYQFAPDLFGQENFQGSTLNLNLKAFVPISNALTLGLHATYDEFFGSVPFYLLPQLGNDEVMRGYYPGRYRDRTLVTSQAELRLRVHPRIGFAAFAGAGTVSAHSFDFSHLKPSYGGGIRYFFDLEHNSSIRLDYGMGERRPGEPRQASFYLSLGEAF